MKTMEGILGDNRVSKRRGVRLTVDRLDKTKKLNDPLLLLLWTFVIHRIQ